MKEKTLYQLLEQIGDIQTSNSRQNLVKYNDLVALSKDRSSNIDFRLVVKDDQPFLIRSIKTQSAQRNTHIIKYGRVKDREQFAAIICYLEMPNKPSIGKRENQGYMLFPDETSIANTLSEISGVTTVAIREAIPK